MRLRRVRTGNTTMTEYSAPLRSQKPHEPYCFAALCSPCVSDRLTSMKLTRVSLKNWRNFRELNVDIHNRLFVVGANASGKSNFLDALRFIGEIARRGGGMTSALDTRGGMKNVRNLNARNFNRGQVTFELHLQDDSHDWIYRLSLHQEKNGLHRPLVAEEAVYKDKNELLLRPNSDDMDDPELLTQTHLEQIAANKSFRQLADFFSSIEYFHLSPQALRETAHGASTSDAFGRGFLAEINSVPEQTRNAWLGRIQAALTAAVPEFESLKLQVDRSGNPHLVAGYRHWRKEAAHQQETEFSDGTLRLIGLLWAVISKSSSSGLLLLEEPELSLNSGIVRVLPTLFARAQRGKSMQIAMSTHSPDLLDDEGVDPAEVLALRVGREGTTGTLISEIESVHAELAAGLPLSDVVDALINPHGLDGLISVAS